MTTATRPRRRLVVLGACVVVLVVLLVVVVRWWGSGLPSPAGPSTQDAEVLVTDVQFQQDDPAYTVASVAAVVQGDRAFLRVELIWPDDDGELHQVPLMGATVTHRAPYEGLTAACGLTGSVAPPQIQGPATLELPCDGLLVPDDVASVELTD